MILSAQHHPRKIESLQNARVKELRAGLQQGVKTSQGHLAIEGQHLLKEAIRSGLGVRAIFVRSGREDLAPAVEGAEVLLLPSTVFESAVRTVHPQGIAALIDPPCFEPLNFDVPKLDEKVGAPPLLVIAGGLQDPGNLGTLVRSAEAFGATGMILFPGAVSLWNSKTLRASSGSAFRLPSWTMPSEEAFPLLRSHGVRLLAAVPRGGDPHPDLTGPVALLVGNEGAGVPRDWIQQADARVTIAYPGAVESLNAAVAGSVLLYEAARQRLTQAKDGRPTGQDAGKAWA